MTTTIKSESVWYEEVDRGLKKLVQQVLGNIPVVFTPNRENTINDNSNPYKPQTYPYVRIVHLGETFDATRYNRQDSVTKRHTSENRATLRKSAKPYNLSYQFEIITNKQTDSNNLTRLWNFEVLDKYNLDVLDKSGKARNCFMTRTTATSILEGYQKDDKIFRNIYRYSIRVELDEAITYELPMITSVNLQFND